MRLHADQPLQHQSRIEAPCESVCLSFITMRLLRTSLEARVRARSLFHGTALVCRTRNAWSVGVWTTVGMEDRDHTAVRAIEHLSERNVRVDCERDGICAILALPLCRAM